MRNRRLLIHRGESGARSIHHPGPDETVIRTWAIRATDSVFLDGQSWGGYGGGVDIEQREPWHVIGRYRWVGGTGTSVYVVPSDGSISILLTQTEMSGAGGDLVLKAFWAAAATHHGHDR